MIQPYDATRKTLKWYRKLVTHLLQISMLNAFILRNKTEGPTMPFLKFQQKVVASLIFAEVPCETMDIPPQENIMRLTERHFIAKVPSTENKKKAQFRCRVCRARYNKRRDVRFYCPSCPSKPGLCIE